MTPSVAIIVPMMDRAADLRLSLPSLLGQDYDNYRVYIVDNSSVDGIDGVLAELVATHPIDRPGHPLPAGTTSPRLTLIRRPRPAVFSFAMTRNCGARYSASDLLLFVNGDTVFDTPHALRTIVDDFLTSPHLDGEWFAQWRAYAGYDPVTTVGETTIGSRFRRVFAHTGGSLLLLDRAAFQQLGGYNESLEDWGYEDTDIVARLEIAGFSRIEMRGARDLSQENAEARRVQHFRVKDRRTSWARNRLISDYLIRCEGVAFAASSRPGASDCVLIDGEHTPGDSGPQQDWVMTRPLPDSVVQAVRGIGREYMDEQRRLEAQATDQPRVPNLP